MTRNDCDYIRDLSARAARRSDAYRQTADSWRQREDWRDAYVQLRAAAVALETALESEGK